MSTHDIPFINIRKENYPKLSQKKITLNYPKSALDKLFSKDSRTSLKQPW